jgi:hypothetical protein
LGRMGLGAAQWQVDLSIDLTAEFILW